MTAQSNTQTVNPRGRLDPESHVHTLCPTWRAFKPYLKECFIPFEPLKGLFSLVSTSGDIRGGPPPPAPLFFCFFPLPICSQWQLRGIQLCCGVVTSHPPPPAPTDRRPHLALLSSPIGEEPASVSYLSSWFPADVGHRTEELSREVPGKKL